MIRVAVHARNLFAVLEPQIKEDSSEFGIELISESEIYYAALLHDIGKLVNGHYLTPPSQRQPKQRHVADGFNYLNHQGYPELFSLVALYHHESWEYKGYLNQDGQGLKALFNDPHISSQIKKAILLSHIVKIADEIDDHLVKRDPNKPKTTDNLTLTEYIEYLITKGEIKPEWTEIVMNYAASLSFGQSSTPH